LVPALCVIFKKQHCHRVQFFEEVEGFCQFLFSPQPSVHIHELQHFFVVAFWGLRRQVRLLLNIEIVGATLEEACGKRAIFFS
jgi:hypothetical protein